MLQHWESLQRRRLEMRVLLLLIERGWESKESGNLKSPQLSLLLRTLGTTQMCQNNSQLTLSVSRRIWEQGHQMSYACVFKHILHSRLQWSGLKTPRVEARRKRSWKMQFISALLHITTHFVVVNKFIHEINCCIFRAFFLFKFILLLQKGCSLH